MTFSGFFYSIYSLLFGASLLFTTIFISNEAYGARIVSHVRSIATRSASYLPVLASAAHKGFRVGPSGVSVASPLHRVTLMPGDGIGPEVASAVQHIIDEAGVPIEWDICEAGAETFRKGSVTGVPVETIESINRNRVALKGPLETPVGHGGKSANVTLRKLFQTYGNIRHVRGVPGILTPYSDEKVDFVVVRENAEDLYTGIEHMQTPTVAQTLKIVSEAGCERIIRLAFALAEAEGRPKVTCATKANIMKMTEGMMKRVFESVAPEFPHIEAEHMIVDNCAHQMAKRPSQFDVLVMTNMNGDILSDQASALVGGLGIAPGVNYGDEVAIFEAVHGSAPDIAGQNKANPTAMLLSSILMLRHLGEFAAADAIESALWVTFANGKHLTGDVSRIAPVGSTTQFTEAVIHNLGKTHPEWVRREYRKLNITSLFNKNFDVPQRTVGMDVFIEYPEGAERLASLLQGATTEFNLKLKMIGDLGLQVFPNVGGIASKGSGHYQCRFVSESGVPVSDVELLELLKRISLLAKWVHTERLQEMAGKQAYAKVQGEE